MNRRQRALLRDARDLLHHPGAHTRRPGESYPPCAGCDVEARIDAELSHNSARAPRSWWRRLFHTDGSRT